MSEPGWVDRRLRGEEALPGSAPRRPRPAGEARTCNRCGFPVERRAMGCKNPCANCGTVYPLGDCSD